MKLWETRRGGPALADLHEIDAVCDRFERAWRAGGRPDIAQYLADVSVNVREQLFRDLLSLDFEFRRRLGEQPEAQTAVHGAPDTDQLGFSQYELHEFSDAGFEVLGELGRGGMGVVLKARQAALNRTVALKVVKSGAFASPAELARFQTEAEAVAQLDHPNIVPIHEVGICRGRHFFSMKLVSGMSLDQRLEQFALEPRASARLVSTVAQAVHHAHQRGILHRDLKPANVLVDEEGEPHVTDFGLAKRLDASLDATQSGAVVGTPSYMSPEQASGSRGAISTSTDVYGLGTILYALLAGRAPFAGTTLIDTLEQVRNKSPEPPSLLNSGVPKDLEVICLKCLEKEPQRRYQSAQALADDLDRWLGGVPILARPTGTARRIVFWCRRNPALAIMAAFLLLALSSGMAGITWKWLEAERERNQAEIINELLTRRLLAGASHELDPRDDKLTVQEMIDRTEAQLGGWLQGQPEVEARIRETIGGVYLSLGHHDKAAAHLNIAIRLDRALHGPGHRDTLRAGNLMALLLDRTKRSGDAETLARANLKTAQATLGALDPITLEAAERLGMVLWHREKNDEAEALLRQNVENRRRVLKPEHPDTLRSVYLLSRVLRDVKKFDDAEQFAYAYAHSIQCSLGSNHPDYIAALANEADIYRDRGYLHQAERHYGQAAREAAVILGADNPITRAAREEHARVIRQLKAGSAGASNSQ